MNFAFNSNMRNLRKARRQTFGIGALLFMMIFGVVFTGVGLAIAKTSKIDSSWTRINGTVVGSTTSIDNGSTTYFPTIKYQVDGQSYQISGNGGSSYPQNGSTRQIAYDPSSPANAKAVASVGIKALLYLFPAVGIIMLVAGPVLFVRSFRRNRDINNLKQRGQKLQGVITDIQSTYNTGYNSGVSTSAGGAYKIVVSATGLDGQVRSYTSDSLQGIGGLAMADFRANPIPIDVYVDPTNPDNYYVDVSEVPNLTPERIIELIQSVAHKPQPIASVPPQPIQVTMPPSAPQPQPQAPPSSGSELPPPFIPSPPQPPVTPQQ